MARRSKQQSTAIDELSAFLRAAPVWIGPIVAMLAYAACRWVVPGVLSITTVGSEFARGVTQPISMFLFRAAPFAAGGVILVWVTAELAKRTDRRRLERQTGADSIRELDWREFELLLYEAFRQEGFVVDHAGKSGPDGGIDLRLDKAGAVTLVQCKHWNARQVGVRVVRELRGVVASEGARSGIVVTSGHFTADATEFAAKNPIRLIDGRELTQMIRNVQTSGRIREQVQAASRRADDANRDGQPVCPDCGAPLIQKTAKRGARIGSEFWGCSRFPKCKYTRDVTLDRETVQSHGPVGDGPFEQS